MKKSIVGIGLLLLSTMCFAGTIVIDDEDSRNDDNSKSLLISVGDTFCYTQRFSEYENLNPYSDEIYSNGFSAEIGFFNSDEDGLFDFVKSSTFGLSFGRVNTFDNYFWKDKYSYFEAGNDAKYGNFFCKESFGPQVNILLFSAGILFGGKIGFDWMKMEALASNPENDYSYNENKIFLDFSLEPYFSFNIRRVLKIFVASEFDFNIFQCSFLKDSEYGAYDFNVNWFVNEVPVTYKAGVVIYF